MKNKLLELLFNKTDWKITFNQKEYRAKEIKALVSGIAHELDFSSYQKEQYIIVVGFNSFEYLLYIMLASLLGLKIILCDPKMLSTLLKHYNLPYFQAIASRQINTKNIPLRKIDWKNFSLEETEIPVVSNQQAELVFFTSGTTSIPKLVIYKEHVLLGNAGVVGNYLGIKKGDKALCMFATHYMYGFSTVFSTILYSGEVILERPTITAQEIWSYLLNDGIQFLPVIRPFIEKLKPFIEEERHYFKNLTILNASDRIYKHHVQDVLKICPTFRNNFGQTESGPRIFSLKIDASNVGNPSCYSHSGVVSLGLPVDSEIQISILNKDLKNCDMNEVGELYYRTPFAMEGYLDVDGNLVEKNLIGSGDLVYRNESNNIFWVGRKTETIKIDGKYTNIGLLHQYFDAIDGVKKSYFTYNDKEGLSGFFVKKKSFTDEEVKNKIISLYRIKFPAYPRIKQLRSVKNIPTTISGKVKYSSLINKPTISAEVQYV